MKPNLIQKHFGKEIPIKSFSHITDHSKKLTSNSIFFARQGLSSHGNSFINDKIVGKAKLIISSKKEPASRNNFFYVKNLESQLLDFLFDYWSIPKTTKFFGITGTNGKTTTAFVLYQLLKKLNKNAIYIGTIGAIINSKWHEVSNTTPGLFDLFELIGKQINKLDLHVVLEVSSHALAQKRLGRLKFNTTLITNIASDHLDFHKTQKNYEEAKLKILAKTKGKVFFAGNSYKILLKRTPSVRKDNLVIIRNSNKNNDKGLISYRFIGEEVELNIGLNKLINLESPFQDNLNKINFVSALSMLSSIEKSSLKNLDTSNIKMPKGRFEVIMFGSEKTIIVDFAHDHNSMKALLKETSKNFKHKILVFGCGGDRDRGKRPKMMRIAAKYADEIIFTSDNSRSEDFSSISKDALSDSKNLKVKLIENRGEAIKVGIAMMKRKGVLYVLGRGHETILEIGQKRFSFNDSKFIRKHI
ncbi:MAG: UDP-N-acetylmuramyl-tripeptide synthetase [Gammaproteobacteria bacterium]